MSQITYPNIREFLKSFQKEDAPLIRSIREEAIADNIPIIKFEVKSLLEVLLHMKKPKRILEIGTATGYSSIIMSECLGDDVAITTIERDEVRCEKAKINIANTNKQSSITLLQGDALEILPTLQETYDFIFMDAAKGQYKAFLPLCIHLLNKEGTLITDNVLQDGLIAKSRWSIPRRQRTIHKRMRAYLWEINHLKGFETSILPVADGVAISYKI